MGIFDDMIDAAFASDIAEAATFTPKRGEAASIMIIPHEGDEISGFTGTRTRSEGILLFDTPRSGLESEPREGDFVTFNTVRYIVKSAKSTDDNRLIWTVSCYPAD